MAHGGARKGAGRPSGITTQWSKEAADRVRAKIQVELIVQRFTDHLKGEIELPSTAIAAGVALLNKVLPNLTSTEVSGEITKNYVVRLPERPKDITQWQQQYDPKLLLPKMN